MTIDQARYMVNLNGQDISWPKRNLNCYRLLAGSREGFFYARNTKYGVGTEVIVGDLYHRCAI